MYSVQSNSARFIYTLNYIHNENNTAQCLLKNGFYFSKESRSDEKIRFTETDMYSIVRTILFMHVFNISPNEDIVEIINTGSVSHTIGDELMVTSMSLSDMVELLDTMLGEGFSSVSKRVINKCFNEYTICWKYYTCNASIKLPSAADYVNLSKFVNISSCTYGDCERFITTNSTDHKVPLQQTIKMLK